MDWLWVCILVRKTGQIQSKIILSVEAETYELARLKAVAGMPGWKLLTLVKRSSNSK